MPDSNSSSLPLKRAAWPVSDWATAVGIGRSTAWKLISAGEVKTVKLGARRLILTPPERFLAQLSDGDQ